MPNKDTDPIDILVVDDDISFRDVVRGQLERRGYTVEVAANGRVAVEFLRRDRCRLIVTDLFMPEADGIEVLLEVKQQQVPVITMSGSMSFDPALFQRIAVQFGACETLLKPFRLEELLAAIRTAIGDPRRDATAT